MGRRYLILLTFAFFSFGIAEAQVEKSSGKVILNMKKKGTVVTPEEQKSGKVDNKEILGGSGAVKLNMSKPTQQQSPGLTNTSLVTTGAIEEINWISPAFNEVNTSEGAYKIQAKVESNEQIRVVNFFVDGQYYKRFMPSAQISNQVLIDEMLTLRMGLNIVKLEAITASNKTVESSISINYDLSSAKFHALIIAVQDYDDPEISDLDKPIKDANRFYGVINSQYTFDEENILFLKNPTKADIIGTLHQMRGILKPEDNLVIFYAGHGYWDEEMQTGYWLPSDANRNNPVNWLPNTDLTNYLNVLNTKHTLLIADACFSGGIFKTRSAFTTKAAIEKLYSLPSRKAITSGNLSEVPDNSVFIKYLIQEMEKNKQDYLSAEQLYSSFKVAVINNSSNVPKYGTIQKVGDEGGDFIFMKR